MTGRHDKQTAIEVSVHQRRARTSRLRRLLMGVSLILFSTLFALVIGEIGVRVFRPQLMFPRYVTNGDFGIRPGAV